MVKWPWSFQSYTPTWKQLAALSQIPNEQMRAGSDRWTRPQLATASNDWVSVRLRCTVEGSD